MDQERFFKLQDSFIYHFFDRLIYLVKINFITLFFGIIGIIIFGWYPALFAQIESHNDVLEDREYRIFQKFWKYYKKWFLRGTILMVITIATEFIGFYLLFKKTIPIPAILDTILYLIFLIWAIMVIIWNLLLPTISVLYPNFKTGKSFLFCLVAACSKPLLTLSVFGISVAWLYLALAIPQLSMFVVFSLAPWFTQWMGKRILRPETFPDPLDESMEEERKKDRTN